MMHTQTGQHCMSWRKDGAENKNHRESSGVLINPCSTRGPLSCWCAFNSFWTNAPFCEKHQQQIITLSLSLLICTAGVARIKRGGWGMECEGRMQREKRRIVFLGGENLLLWFKVLAASREMNYWLEITCGERGGGRGPKRSVWNHSNHPHTHTGVLKHSYTHTHRETVRCTCACLCRGRGVTP